MNDAPSPSPPLAGVRVLDLSRVLAGPWCTQTLADLGADVVKIERPMRNGAGGDDTRGWGPPFLVDRDGRETRESAYFLCANRNKRSIAAGRLGVVDSDGPLVAVGAQVHGGLAPVLAPFGL